MGLRWVELLAGTPEPGAHAIVRDGLLVRWVNTGRAGADRWTWLAADELTSVGAHPRPVLLPWSSVVARGPLQLSLDAGGVGTAAVVEHFEQTGGPVELQADDPPAMSAEFIRHQAATLATMSSREACRDISGAEAVGAELVDLAHVWESYLTGGFAVDLIGDDELERFRNWEANQRTPEATDPDRPYTVADMEADGDDV